MSRKNFKKCKKNCSLSIFIFIIMNEMKNYHLKFGVRSINIDHHHLLSCYPVHNALNVFEDLLSYHFEIALIVSFV